MDSLDLDGFKVFILYNDERTIGELLFNFKKYKISLTDQKITLCEMKFSVSTWENIPHTKKERLTTMAQIFFHLLQKFAKLKKTNDMNILILEQPVQELASSNCGIFQLYFYKNLFNPNEKVKLLIMKI